VHHHALSTSQGGVSVSSIGEQLTPVVQLEASLGFGEEGSSSAFEKRTLSSNNPHGGPALNTENIIIGLGDHVRRALCSQPCLHMRPAPRMRATRFAHDRACTAQSTTRQLEA
jgi:hypothetical protein